LSLYIRPIDYLRTSGHFTSCPENSELYIWCAQPQRLAAISEALTAEKIDALLHKWLRRLPHPFAAKDRAAGYRHDLSILQAELSSPRCWISRSTAGCSSGK